MKYECIESPEFFVHNEPKFICKGNKKIKWNLVFIENLEIQIHREPKFRFIESMGI